MSRPTLIDNQAALELAEMRRYLTEIDAEAEPELWAKVARYVSELEDLTICSIEIQAEM